ncbi:conjugative transfer signal peptidase TraF [Devosia sp. LjRoot3]|uniref:conjugative transfer signal peptidase TraF n=1 Tax=Devosia sp. LjRoot3 TaxID=3342319 RepID=UPI003ECD78F4
MTVRGGRAAFVLAIMVIPVLILVAAHAAGYRLNLTPSYPLGVWRVVPLERDVAIGDLVFICPPITPTFRLAQERDYVRRGSCPGWLSPLIKTVVAQPGQTIAIAQRVIIDGHALPQSEIHPVDAEGRVLVPYAGGVVPAGQIFLHSSFAGSYDSRYFGPIPVDGILGRAKPLLVFAP